jgi:hypothetical protein
MAEMSEERLARIENKVDNLAEAMVTMARIEERMVTIFKRMDRYDDAQDRIDAKLSALDKNSNRRNVIESILDRGFWIVVAGVVMWYFRK